METSRPSPIKQTLMAVAPEGVVLDGRCDGCYRVLNPMVVTLTRYAEALGKEVVVSFR